MTYIHGPATSRQPRAADVVLYVDLDGVLQSQWVMLHPKQGVYIWPSRAPGRVLFEWAPILVEVLRPFPEVRCVLSSSWCVRPGYGRTLKRLLEDLGWRFIGGTYHRCVFGPDVWAEASFREKPRWLQVCEDVNRRKPKRWLALDDDVGGWPSWTSQNFIVCDGDLGLSRAQTRALLTERLESVHLDLRAGG